MGLTSADGRMVIESGPDYVHSMTWDWWKDNLISRFRRSQKKGESVNFDGVALYVREPGSVEMNRVNVRILVNEDEGVVIVSFRHGKALSLLYRVDDEPLMFTFPLHEES